MATEGPNRRAFSGRADMHSRKARKAMKIITEEEYHDLPAEFKGSYKDYYGDHPEWKDRQIAAFPCELPGLFIEGVNLRIIRSSSNAKEES